MRVLYARWFTNFPHFTKALQQIIAAAPYKFVAWMVAETSIHPFCLLSFRLSTGVKVLPALRLCWVYSQKNNFTLQVVVMLIKTAHPDGRKNWF